MSWQDNLFTTKPSNIEYKYLPYASLFILEHKLAVRYGFTSIVVTGPDFELSGLNFEPSRGAKANVKHVDDLTTNMVTLSTDGNLLDPTVTAEYIYIYSNGTIDHVTSYGETQTCKFYDVKSQSDFDNTLEKILKNVKTYRNI